MRGILLFVFFMAVTAFAAKPTGLVVPQFWEKKAKFEKPMSFVVALPSKFDWRESGLTPVVSQKDCGSCWAFSTAAVMADLIKIKHLKIEDISEQYLLSCNTQGWSCDGGFFAHDMHVNPGAVLEKEFPYSAKMEPCKQKLTHVYKLFNWSYIPAGKTGVPSIADIKNAIYNYGPIAAAIDADDNVMNYKNGVFSNCAKNPSVNHAINIVGWDDSTGSWIMRNSWGPEWGEGGYMRIKYGCNNIGYAANYAVLQESPAPVPSVTPTPVPTLPPALLGCIPLPVSNAGQDITIFEPLALELGSVALEGHKYQWMYQNKKYSNASKILVYVSKTSTFTLLASTKCGLAKSSVTINLVSK